MFFVVVGAAVVVVVVVVVAVVVVVFVAVFVFVGFCNQLYLLRKYKNNQSSGRGRGEERGCSKATEFKMCGATENSLAF